MTCTYHVHLLHVSRATAPQAECHHRALWTESIDDTERAPAPALPSQRRSGCLDVPGSVCERCAALGKSTMAPWPRPKILAFALWPTVRSLSRGDIASWKHERTSGSDSTPRAHSSYESLPERSTSITSSSCSSSFACCCTNSKRSPHALVVVGSPTLSLPAPRVSLAASPHARPPRDRPPPHFRQRLAEVLRAMGCCQRCRRPTPLSYR